MGSIGSFVINENQYQIIVDKDWYSYYDVFHDIDNEYQFASWGSFKRHLNKVSVDEERSHVPSKRLKKARDSYENQSP